jgi:Zn-dependent protease with chaperone function
MISAQGFWFDGKVSARREVTISCGADAVLHVVGNAVEVSARVKDLKIDPSLGTARRMIRFPGGAAAETADMEFLDKLQRLQGKGGFFRAVHRWESSLLRAFCALLLMLLAGYGFARYAVPFLATKAAFALPASTEEFLGRETLQVLDKIVLKPTKLPRERRNQLTKLFATMTVSHPERRGWRLEFRSGEAVGANAFALPAGIVIVTDRLVELAKSDGEIAGVLAHEIGHVNRRHALRHLMQNSATALLITTVTGDITSVTSLSATLPAVLIGAKYSRDFEQEADDSAVVYLKEKGIPVQSYADMLTRLGEDHRKKNEAEKDDSSFGELFADHPLIEERVKRVLGKGAE